MEQTDVLNSIGYGYYSENAPAGELHSYLVSIVKSVSDADFATDVALEWFLFPLLHSFHSRTLIKFLEKLRCHCLLP